MHRREYTTLHILAILLGLGCIAVLISSNVQHIHHVTGTYYDPMIAAVVAVTAATAIGFACFLAACRQKNIITAPLLLLSFLAGSAFEVSTTLERVSTQRDAAMERKIAADEQGQQLLEIRKKVTYMAARECALGKNPGRGKGCKDLEGEVEVANKRIKARFNELDSGAKRFEALSAGFVSTEMAGLLLPALLPIALFLFGNVLFGWGAEGRKVPPEFDLGLTGRAAVEDKAKRYAIAFERQHGRKPRPAEMAKAIGTTGTQARTLARRVNGSALH